MKSLKQLKFSDLIRFSFLKKLISESFAIAFWITIPFTMATLLFVVSEPTIKLPKQPFLQYNIKETVTNVDILFFTLSGFADIAYLFVSILIPLTLGLMIVSVCLNLLAICVYRIKSLTSK